jgi:hypothetical protein
VVKRIENLSNRVVIARNELAEKLAGWLADEDHDPTTKDAVQRALQKWLREFLKRVAAALEEGEKGAKEEVARLDRAIDDAVRRRWKKLSARCPSIGLDGNEVRLATGNHRVSFSLGKMSSDLGGAAAGVALGAALASLVPILGTVNDGSLFGVQGGFLDCEREEAREKISAAVNERNSMRLPRGSTKHSANSAQPSTGRWLNCATGVWKPTPGLSCRLTPS